MCVSEKIAKGRENDASLDTVFSSQVRTQIVGFPAAPLSDLDKSALILNQAQEGWKKPLPFVQALLEKRLNIVVQPLQYLPAAQ
jgi:hypothetical protein